jgi:hypothetical protein
MMQTEMVYALGCSLTLSAILFAVVAGKRWAQRPWFWGALTAAVLPGVLFMAAVSEPWPLLSDFVKAYYPAGRVILHDPSHLYNKVQAGQPDESPGFVNLPLYALLFTPLRLFRIGAAMYVMTFLGMFAVSLAWYELVRLMRLTLRKQFLLIALLMTCGPLINSLKEGNLTHFLLPVVGGALLCLKKRLDGFAGTCLAVAALIKLPLFLVMAPFVLRRHWRVLAGFVAGLALMGGTSLLLFGVELHRTWWRECIDPFAGRPLTAFNVQSISGFLARLLTDGGLMCWLPVDVDGRYPLLRRALLALLVVLTAWVLWRSRQRISLAAQFTEFSIFLVLALLISPISWTHYYCLLLLPVALYVGDYLTVPCRPGWSIGVGAAVLLIWPVVIIPTGETAWGRLLVSHVFFGGTVLLGALLAGHGRVQAAPTTPAPGSPGCAALHPGLDSDTPPRIKPGVESSEPQAHRKPIPVRAGGRW